MWNWLGRIKPNVLVLAALLAVIYHAAPEAQQGIIIGAIVATIRDFVEG